MAAFMEKEIAPFTFFAKYPDFKYRPKARIGTEFRRLAQHQNWKPRSKTWHKKWNACMGESYDRLIGDRICDLATWQKMCDKLRLKGDLTSIRKCRNALSKVFVNIVDLLDCWNLDRYPRRFPTCDALANFTISRRMYFNRDIAKQDKALRVLLKKIL